MHLVDFYLDLEDSYLDSLKCANITIEVIMVMGHKYKDNKMVVIKQHMVKWILAISVLALAIWVLALLKFLH